MLEQKLRKEQRSLEYTTMMERGKSAPKNMPDSKYGMEDLLLQMSYDEHEEDGDDGDDDDEEELDADDLIL